MRVGKSTKYSAIILAFAAVFAVADVQEDFSKVDKDKDGVLSIDEAKSAFSELKVEDTNKDGLLNQAEIQQLIPGLRFSPNPQNAVNAPIGVAEYRLILQGMPRRDVTSRSN